MESAVVTAMAGVMGSLVGGSATVATTWLTHRTQTRREFIRLEIRKREMLYGEFIDVALRTAVPLKPGAAELLDALAQGSTSSLQSFIDGFMTVKEPQRDLLGAETAQDLQREDDLGFARNSGYV